MAKTADKVDEPKKVTKKVTTKKATKQAVEAPKVAIVEDVVVEEESKTTLAKAGKRSQKAIREAEEKQAKEERKAAADKAEAKPKIIAKPAKSRLERRSKNYRKASEKIDKSKTYSLEEALKLAKASSTVKFDASVEMHVNLGVDPRHSDQNVRDNVTLPSGSGKKVKVAVLTEDTAAAKAAGADLIGMEELLADIEKGKLNFDILITTPQLMPKLGKYARILGPRGLMPNPKSGTVTTDLAKAINEAKAGRVEYRVDSSGIVHLAIGKVSFTEKQLLDNAEAVLTSLKNNKPASVKGTYLKTVHITTTMGPSVRLDAASLA